MLSFFNFINVTARFSAECLGEHRGGMGAGGDTYFLSACGACDPHTPAQAGKQSSSPGGGLFETSPKKEDVTAGETALFSMRDCKSRLLSPRRGSVEAWANRRRRCDSVCKLRGANRHVCVSICELRVAERSARFPSFPRRGDHYFAASAARVGGCEKAGRGDATAATGDPARPLISPSRDDQNETPSLKVRLGALRVDHSHASRPLIFSPFTKTNQKPGRSDRLKTGKTIV